MAAMLSALRTRRSLLYRNIIIVMFLVLIFLRLSKFQVLVLLKGLGKFKKKNHLIGYRIRDLPVCSVVR
jgi:hypothetical protein